MQNRLFKRLGEWAMLPNDALRKAMGELGVLDQGSKYERAEGAWPSQYMMWLGFIIAGGTAQIQKNIIAQRGLGLPR